VRERSLRFLDPGRPVVMYAGTFGPINDVAWLADVAAASRRRGDGLQFVAVGDGAGRQTLVERAQALGVLERDLWVLPPIPKREMPGLLGNATIATSLFLPMPEMRANSANKFFDALAAGRPVAINYGGWHADLLRDSGAGLAMPQGDPAEAAAQLHAFASDGPGLARARAAALGLARTRFDRDVLAHELEQVLVAVAGRSASAVARAA
jgi:glycosyltransferase involved in cell wall biosynthesis